ncbi:MAG TPA: bifunctional lysylphosphatidylglycerol flippase/synthetase MprF [Candidatus Sulfotelmatobacter sp.]|jgi:phosphatidylglycerol lysyltransferase|nr:bifunctional lysylphosphatidylglycerol flippase/synthetase MprF [Candidatus Sulfotelmatobacter sp.]
MSERPAAQPEAAGERHALWEFLPFLRAAWPWLVMGTLAIVGWKELREVDLHRVRSLLHDTDPALVALIVIVTAINLALAGLYDVVALGPGPTPTRTQRWSVGTISFAWSNFLTIGPLAGPALRIWLYAPMEVGFDRARRALVTIIVAFSATLGAWSGAVLLPLPLTSGWPRFVLAAALGTAAAIGAAAIGPLWKDADLAGRRRRALSLATVGVADWTLAWVVFHLAVGSQIEGIRSAQSMQIFFLGQAIGLASFVPGGLGTADMFWGATLSAASGHSDRVAAALLLYRAIYYVLPFLFASVVLLGRVVGTRRRTAVVVRTGLASYAFLCGAVLLASAASPAIRERSILLEKTIPLSLVELSHGTSVVLGFMLILISRGLARGYRSSLHLSIGIFLAAALTTFLKGLDYEEAILALIAAVLLIVFRSAFTREGRLHPSIAFTVSMGLAAVLLFAAVGVGSYDAWPGLPDAFSRFEIVAHEERFLRGLIVLVSVVSLAALWLGQRPRSPDRLPAHDEIERAIEDVRRLSRVTNPLLVATGDKAIFRRPGGDDGFIAYRSQGRYLFAWSDPVCPPEETAPLLSAFVEHAADWDREAVLYQITPALLPIAHDLGFSFFKLGEEAIVDLAAFDLKGNKAKAHRHVVNVSDKAGATFRIVEADALRARLPEMRRVSDAWLSAKRTTEKGFSLGRFEDDYLMRFPAALVEDSAGRVAAFANIFDGPRKEEMSIDLMRYEAGTEEGRAHVMEYLLIRLLLDAKQRGYLRFNLGMAPLAAVGQTRRARPVERLAHQFFLHGEAWYNYQGLRRFKERFHPSWEPRYMAYRRPWEWPFAVASATQLISGGWRPILAPKGAAA